MLPVSKQADLASSEALLRLGKLKMLFCKIQLVPVGCESLNIVAPIFNKCSQPHGI